MGAQAVRLSNVDIDHALKNKDFEVLFQPIFDLSTGAFARVEAFVRWRHRALGVLPPGAFISYFETQGRMSELTRYVLDRALAEYLEWRGPTAPGFSINLALSDLADDAFANHLSVHLRDRGIAPELITLECPMPPVTMDLDEAAAHFQRLSDTGVRLAIEVRGRANDFLKTIDPFPFDEIKTGGAAILRFARTVRGPGLSAIAELLEIAKKARASIVAVGVEDQASLAALRSLGFTAAQGNHLAQVGSLANLPVEKVNEVRPLLGLAPLADEEVAALIGPAPAAQQPKRRTKRAAEKPVAPAAEPKEQDGRETIERLNARIARQNEASAEPDNRARIKAALGASKGAALTKAAAIAKAKRKVGAATGHSGDEHDEDTFRDADVAHSEAVDAAPDAPAAAAPARRLFDRLTKAFDRSEPAAPIREDQSAAHPDLPEPVAARAPSDRDDAVKLDEPPIGATTPVLPERREIAPLSLPVGAARAYFRPAIHVAAAPQSFPQHAPPTAPSDIIEFRVSDAPPTSLLEPVVVGPPPELRDPPALAAPSPIEPPLKTPEAAPPEMVAATPKFAAAQRRARGRKVRHYLDLPLLGKSARVYLPPKHFWPASWRRWWSQRATEKSARI